MSVEMKMLLSWRPKAWVRKASARESRSRCARAGCVGDGRWRSGSWVVELLGVRRYKESGKVGVVRCGLLG